jgi:hypothetical protein
MAFSMPAQSLRIFTRLHVLFIYGLQKTREDYGHNLRLATYLQLPVLHITKYHLLLQRYLKLTDKSDEYIFPVMADALCLMKKANDDINSHITDEISTNKFLSNKNTKELVEMYGQIAKEVKMRSILAFGNSP